MVARRGEPNNVDDAFISPCNEFGISPLMNERRLNLRTVSASTRARLETQVDERHGRALMQSHEEVRELQAKLEEERYDHLLAKEAVVLRAKTQQRKDKEAITQAQDKQHKLHDLVTLALEAQSCELEDTNAKYREADTELRSLRTEV
jgi:hypothetical protein